MYITYIYNLYTMIADVIHSVYTTYETMSGVYKKQK